MEAILFIGIQAVGKSSFYVERFYQSHLRINLDMLKTRHREALIFQACLEAKQPLVIDNTNPTALDRQRYLEPARKAGFRCVGYYFSSRVEDALARNRGRPEEQQVPAAAIFGAAGKLQRPALEEGFDELFYVELDSPRGFLVKEWQP